MEEVKVISVEHNIARHNRTILRHDVKLVEGMVTTKGNLDQWKEVLKDIKIKVARKKNME